MDTFGEKEGVCKPQHTEGLQKHPFGGQRQAGWAPVVSLTSQSSWARPGAGRAWCRGCGTRVTKVPSRRGRASSQSRQDLGQSGPPRSVCGGCKPTCGQWILIHWGQNPRLSDVLVSVEKNPILLKSAFSAVLTELNVGLKRAHLWPLADPLSRPSTLPLPLFLPGRCAQVL